MEQINILIITTLIVMIPTLYLSITTTGIDKVILIFSIIGQIITLIGCYIKNKTITEIGHIIFGIIIFIVPIFAQCNYILKLVSFVLLLTLVSRKLCNNCIFHYDKKRKKIFNFIPNFDWDLTYFFLLIIAVFRIFFK